VVVAAELADVRRYLADVPPHHGSGVRDQLSGRLRALERELERARAATRTGTDPPVGRADGPPSTRPSP
jgi:hypothetical protein